MKRQIYSIGTPYLTTLYIFQRVGQTLFGLPDIFFSFQLNDKIEFSEYRKVFKRSVISSLR